MTFMRDGEVFFVCNTKANHTIADGASLVRTAVPPCVWTHKDVHL